LSGSDTGLLDSARCRPARTVRRAPPSRLREAAPRVRDSRLLWWILWVVTSWPARRCVLSDAAGTVCIALPTVNGISVTAGAMLWERRCAAEYSPLADRTVHTA